MFKYLHEYNGFCALINILAEIREDFRSRYKATKSLYYQGKPYFGELLERIAHYLKLI